jgi:Mrp family chromosome partitioning ATPase
MRLSGEYGCLATCLRVAGEMVAGGLRPVVVELVPDPRPAAGLAHGLFDVLTGKVALGDVVDLDPDSAVHVVRAGDRPQGYEAVVASGRMELVVDALLRRFDVAIIAAGGVDDREAAAAISRLCDLALVAAPSNQLSGSHIRSVVRSLRGLGIEQAAIVSESPEALTLYDAVTMRGLMVEAA